MIKATIAGMLIFQLLVIVATSCKLDAELRPNKSPSANNEELSPDMSPECPRPATFIKGILEKNCNSIRFGQKPSWFVMEPMKLPDDFFPNGISGWLMGLMQQITTNMTRPVGMMQQTGISSNKQYNEVYQYSNNSIIWLIPLAENNGKVKDWAEIKKWLAPSPAKHEFYRRMIFMGMDKNYAWYCEMPICEYLAISKELKLHGGEDKIQLAIDATMISDGSNEIYSDVFCEYLYSCGSELIPYLDNMITNHFPMREQIFRQLSSDDPKLISWLIAHIDCQDAYVAKAIKNNLLDKPRKSAASYYRAQLEKTFDKPDIRLLEACMKIDMPGLEEYCRQILANPLSWREYKMAANWLRKQRGIKTPAELEQNEKLILNYLQNKYHPSPKQDIISESEVDKLIDSIAASPDKYEALAFGMQMLNYPADKGTTNSQIDTANMIGKRVLEKLCAKNHDIRYVLTCFYNNNDEATWSIRFAEILGMKPDAPRKSQPRKFVPIGRPTGK